MACFVIHSVRVCTVQVKQLGTASWRLIFRTVSLSIILCKFLSKRGMIILSNNSQLAVRRPA
jgi:hypothetical protein